ncbi:hypothetical protein [Persicobacter psychrovividus]|uniref:DUF1643 domain-containing protein n=1 Tax=Persicobacter psychrovividus TaxID=387638 RepID=A0ABM7VIA6_9BACT|nr:hypothetical protein PEPS_29670 [Persicobacter psychrovividus]
MLTTNELLDYRCFGYFYELPTGEEARKYFDIVHHELVDENTGEPQKAAQPDIIIVLLNPASVNPMNGLKGYNCDFSPAIPANVHASLALLINTKNYQYLRILNLSDFAYSNSESIISAFPRLEMKLPEHSLFDPSRAEDFDRYFVKGIPVIIAWGKHKSTANLAYRALNKIKAISEQEGSFLLNISEEEQVDDNEMEVVNFAWKKLPKKPISYACV